MRTFMDDMLETMYETNGIGLSAVQVGRMERIVTMDVHHGSSRYPDEETDENHAPYFMVNPEIVDSTEETHSFEEGCLSFPGQYGEVTRPERSHDTLPGLSRERANHPLHRLGGNLCATRD